MQLETTFVFCHVAKCYFFSYNITVKTCPQNAKVHWYKSCRCNRIMGSYSCNARKEFITIGKRGDLIVIYRFVPRNQALTTPLARLPGIARNDRRATTFVGRSCPPNFFLRQAAKWLSLSVESTFAHGINDLISRVFSLIIWTVKYWTLIWLINDKMQIRLQYLEWLSIHTVQDNGITVL